MKDVWAFLLPLFTIYWIEQLYSQVIFFWCYLFTRDDTKLLKSIAIICLNYLKELFICLRINIDIVLTMMNDITQKDRLAVWLTRPTVLIDLINDWVTVFIDCIDLHYWMTVCLIDWSINRLPWMIDLFIHSFIHSFISSVRSFIHFVRTYVRSFVRSFIHSFVRSFIWSFLCGKHHHNLDDISVIQFIKVIWKTRKIINVSLHYLKKCVFFNILQSHDNDIFYTYRILKFITNQKKQ